MESINTNEVSMNKNIPKIIFLICLTVISVFSILTFLNPNKVYSTITVTGKSDITAKPDLVKFVVTRVNTGVDVSSAIDDGTTGINKLITIVKEMGGSDIKIKKAFYQITAGTSNYSISNGFSVETSNVDVINTLIKKLYANGATTISNVTYESNDVKNVESELRNDVYADAKEKAELIAKSAGKHLGRVVSITDDDSNITTAIIDMKDSDGNVNFSKSVSVVYRIW